jgi:hypothetical protein
MATVILTRFRLGPTLPLLAKFADYIFRRNQLGHRSTSWGIIRDGPMGDAKRAGGGLDVEHLGVSVLGNVDVIIEEVTGALIGYTLNCLQCQPVVSFSS